MVSTQLLVSLFDHAENTIITNSQFNTTTNVQNRINGAWQALNRNLVLINIHQWRASHSGQEFCIGRYLQLSRTTKARCAKVPSQHAQGGYGEAFWLDLRTNRCGSFDYVALWCGRGWQVRNRTHTRWVMREVRVTFGIVLLLEGGRGTQQCKPLRGNDCSSSRSGNPSLAWPHHGSRRIQSLHFQTIHWLPAHETHHWTT